VERRFFPLDEELGLLPGSLTPTLLRHVARLGARMPFADVPEELHDLVGVDISEPTARRHGQAAGAAYVALQTAETEAIQEKMPPSPPGPDLQQVSVDGAMIPLVHKEWGEVRTVAIGVVEKPVVKKGEPVVHTREVSYFSRLCDAEAFTHLALVETHRRGTERAKKVCGVVDGAEWEQGFLDMHCPDAVRILDFSHAAGYLASAAQAAYGEGTAEAQSWYEAERHRLRHETPEVVLDAVRRLCGDMGGQGIGRTAAEATITGSLAYLEKRTEQMRYAQFAKSGYPLGSGMVESGNKLVVEARLKGAGMHWARVNVNPMLGLRNIVCSDRWEEAWPQICRQMRERRQEQSRERRRKQQDVCAQATPHLSLDAAAPDIPRQPHVAARQHLTQQKIVALCNLPSRRPAADHPWRRPLLPRKGNRLAGQSIQQET
jgi:hypothetical protein